MVLSNGMEFPAIGLGTWELQPNNAENAIFEAICSGYRLIDTAPVYETEEVVGKAVKRAYNELGIENVLVSSKLSNDAQGYYSTQKAIQSSLEKLQRDAIDVYLIHWPIPRGHENDYQELNIETWMAMEEAYSKGYVKAIGVCNFLERHLQNIILNSKIPPMVNQLELHPFYQQKATVEFCQKQGIVVESWGPFRHGRVFTDALLLEMSKKKQVSVSELCLSWLKEKGVVPLPKSSALSRMKSNLNAMQKAIEWTDEEMSIMGQLDSLDGHEDFWNYKRQLSY